MSNFLSSLSNVLSGNSMNENMQVMTDENRQHSEEKAVYPGFSTIETPPEPTVRQITKDISVRKTKLKVERPPPKIREMVNGAIVQMKQRFGSSVDSILTFLVKKYRVNPEKARRSIRRYVSSASRKGDLLRITREDHPDTFKMKPSALKLYRSQKIDKSHISSRVIGSIKKSASGNLLLRKERSSTICCKLASKKASNINCLKPTIKVRQPNVLGKSK